MAYSDEELLARLIQCEAGGEGDNGMRAVASVIMNRVHAEEGEYARVSEGGNLKNIVFQPDQFECAEEDRRQNLFNMRPEQQHYDIARWALAGNRLTDLGETLWFFNPFSETCPNRFPSSVGYFQVRIGDHCFYDPAPSYKDT